MIFYFETQLSYKDLEASILSKILSLALVDTEIINKKLANNLSIGWVNNVAKLTSSFISTSLGLMLKHDGD